MRKSNAASIKDRIHRRISSWLQQNWYALPPPCASTPAYPLLRLASKLYASALERDQHRAMTRRRTLPAFVISVGNLAVGGAGKTPLALWLANHLCAMGRRPAILTRGYGRRGASVRKVPSSARTPEEVLQFGDEPLLMARKAAPVPVWVGRNRWESGSLAIRTDHVDILILDDGFQHLALERSLDLVLIDAHNPFGNGSLLPLGPLREPVDHLDRAHALLLTRAEDPAKTRATAAKISRWFPGKPIFSCVHRLMGFIAGLDGPCIPPTALCGRKAVAFAGIARPESFFGLLQASGILLSSTHAFPDHYPYALEDMAMLVGATKKDNAACLITTEKDMVRLPPRLRTSILTSVVEIDFLLEHQAFCSFLREELASCRPR